MAVASPNLRGEGGIVLEKPYSWSPATEVVSVKEFSRQAKRSELETGYREYFIGSDGKRFSVERDKIAKVIFCPDAEAYTDIADQAQLSPILADINELKSLAAKYPLAKPYLERQMAKLEREISLFRQGGAKIGGTWHTPEEMARLRQEAADRDAKLQAARKAEEERLAAIRAEEERVAMEKKASADAALAKRVAEFRKETMDVLANTSVPQSDFRKLRSLDDVKELATAEQERISVLAEKVRSLREQDEGFVEACRTEMAVALALETRAKLPREIHANNAPAALADLNSFLRDNPSPPSDAQEDLWKSLASIRALCTRLESEARPHIEKAESLSSSGKAGDAIEEFQIAYRLFPDPKVADTIKQLRENSLGL